MNEEFNWDDCDIEGARRVLEANGYLLTATYLQRIPGRMATLAAALTDNQAYNQQLVGQLTKKQNENNQLQAHLDAAMARIAELEMDDYYQKTQKQAARIGELEQTILYLTAQCQECVEKLQPDADSHIESIVCPNCNHVEQATVLHTAPFASYVHVCTQCGYIIMESEWLTVEQMIQERTKE